MKQLRLNSVKLYGYLAFLFFIFLVISYYVYHKPLTSNSATYLLQAIFHVATAILITSVAGGLGRKVFAFPGFHPLVRIALQAGLGFGGLGTALLLLGVLNFYTSFSAWIITLGLLVICFRDMLGWWREWSEVKAIVQEGDAISKVIASLVAIILGFSLVVALAPPLKFDALVYHLPLPHEFIEAERMVFIPENMFWGMPLLGEMLFTWAILLAGDISAVLLGWVWGCLTLAGLLGFIRERFGIRAGWIGLAALLSGFSLAIGLSWGYMDWLVMLYGFGFFIMIFEYHREYSRLNLILSAVFAGLAFGTKYTAGVLLISGVLVHLFFFKENASPGMRFRKALTWLLIAILSASPWLIKNLLATGNPFYPFFFPSGSMDAFRLEQYRGAPIESLWHALTLLPIRATLSGVESSPGYGASIGPLLLGFSLFAALGWRNFSVDTRIAISSALWIILPGLVSWIFASQFSDYLLQSRLYFVIFPALTVLAAAGFSSLEKYFSGGINFGWIASLIGVLVLGLCAFEIIWFTLQKGSIQAVIGMTSHSDYLSANLGWYYPAVQAINKLPEEEKVLMLWEPRSLYCFPRCTPDEILDRWLQERHSNPHGLSPGVSEIIQEWLNNGYSYILLNKFGADYIRLEDNDGYQMEDWQALEDLLDRLQVQGEFGSAYILYSLPP